MFTNGVSAEISTPHCYQKKHRIQRVVILCHPATVRSRTLSQFAYFEGASALSRYRLDLLLQNIKTALRQQSSDHDVLAAVSVETLSNLSIDVRFLHVAECSAPLSSDDNDKLQSLLTYGEADALALEAGAGASTEGSSSIQRLSLIHI